MPNTLDCELYIFFENLNSRWGKAIGIGTLGVHFNPFLPHYIPAFWRCDTPWEKSSSQLQWANCCFKDTFLGIMVGRKELYQNHSPSTDWGCHPCYSKQDIWNNVTCTLVLTFNSLPTELPKTKRPFLTHSSYVAICISNKRRCKTSQKFSNLGGFLISVNVLPFNQHLIVLL